MEKRVKKLSWICYRPMYYPCSLCGYNEAETVTTITDGPVKFNFPLCKECSELPPELILKPV